MQPKELSVSSLRMQSNWSKHSTDRKNSLSGIQKNPKISEEAFHPVQPTSKRRKGNAEARTATLGENPKEARAALRSQLEPGYFVCLSGKKKIKTLHQLGTCYLLPGVDYLDYSYHGVALPRISTHDCIRRQRWRRLFVHRVLLKYVF